MELGLLTELLMWFVGLVSAYPAGLMVLTIIGTLVVIMSIVAPIAVKLTETDKDDKVWEYIQNHNIFKAVLKVFGSFSLYLPKHKKKIDE